MLAHVFLLTEIENDCIQDKVIEALKSNHLLRKEISYVKSFLKEMQKQTQ